MITFRVSNYNKTIRNINRQIKGYEKNELFPKVEKFIERLIQKGIIVAQQNGGKYAPYLVFNYTLDRKSKEQTTFVFTGKKTQDLTVSWITNQGTKTSEIDPMLMAEFGSGFLAYDVWGINGVGQGTHPTQVHAFDPDGWYWKDNLGKHHSIGEQPMMPMYKAWVEMQSKITETAKEVFNT